VGEATRHRWHGGTEPRRGGGSLPEGGSVGGADKWHGGLFYRRSREGNVEPGGACQRKARQSGDVHARASQQGNSGMAAVAMMRCETAHFGAR
jgi:hypothetical protein